MSNRIAQVQEACLYVEVLTAETDGSIFGHRFVSENAGPQLVVASTCATSEVIVKRLMKIPSLPWAKGSLVLIRLDALDGMLGDLGKVSPLGSIDRVIVLPGIDLTAADKAPLRRGYRALLRACVDLELISGRGSTNKIEALRVRVAGKA